MRDNHNYDVLPVYDTVGLKSPWLIRPARGLGPDMPVCFFIKVVGGLISSWVAPWNMIGGPIMESIVADVTISRYFRWYFGRTADCGLRKGYRATRALQTKGFTRLCNDRPLGCRYLGFRQSCHKSANIS